jgi:hypothetical protein
MTQNDEFVGKFFDTIHRLVGLMVITDWENRKTVWEKLGTARNTDEYGLIVDHLFRQKVPEAPRGVFSAALDRDLKGTNIQEMHANFHNAINDPALEVTYIDAVSSLFSEHNDKIAGVLSENAMKIMIAMTTVCGNRWCMTNNEFTRIANAALAFNHMMTFDDRLDYIMSVGDEILPQKAKSSRFCNKCANSSNLSMPNKTRLVAGRSNASLVGKTKIFCALFCSNCPRYKDAPESIETFIWKNKFPCVIVDVELKGQSF